MVDEHKTYTIIVEGAPHEWPKEKSRMRRW